MNEVWEYINEVWEWVLANSFLGIHNSKIICSVDVRLWKQTQWSSASWRTRPRGSWRICSGLRAVCVASMSSWVHSGWYQWWAEEGGPADCAAWFSLVASHSDHRAEGWLMISVLKRRCAFQLRPRSMRCPQRSSRRFWKHCRKKANHQPRWRWWTCGIDRIVINIFLFMFQTLALE